MIDDKQIRDAIHASIAEKILAGMDDTHRDALIVDSITKALTSYDFSREIEKVVSNKAARLAQRMVETDEWSQKIEQIIAFGFEGYLISLRKSMQNALVEMFNGREGSYGSPGKILGHWPTESKPGK